MKQIFAIIITFSLFFLYVDNLNDYKYRNLEVVNVNNITTFTAYNTLAAQTDDSPCIGARNNNLCELAPILKVEGKKICASRDLPLDTEIYIEGIGICVIKDRMNIRYKGTGRVDILMDTREEAINFGIKKLSYTIL